MAKTNKKWHSTHRMPAHATDKQKVKWHLAHAENCGCRPIPKGVLALMKAQGVSVRKKKKASTTTANKNPSKPARKKLKPKPKPAAKKSTTKSAFPVPFEKLKYDPTLGEYATKLKHVGKTISISFAAESLESLQKILPKAIEFWQSRDRWFEDYREYAVRELLAELNGVLDCGEEDPPVVTADQLRGILKAPFQIYFYSEELGGGFQISGGEDDALEENCIEVTGNFESGFDSGEISSLL